LKVTSYVEMDPESGKYIAIVPSIPGAHTQADSLDELQKNLKEVVQLCLQEMDSSERRMIPEFVGVQQLEVSID